MLRQRENAKQTTSLRQWNVQSGPSGSHDHEHRLMSGRWSNGVAASADLAVVAECDPEGY